MTIHICCSLLGMWRVYSKAERQELNKINERFNVRISYSDESRENALSYAWAQKALRPEKDDIPDPGTDWPGELERSALKLRAAAIAVWIIASALTTALGPTCPAITSRGNVGHWPDVQAEDVVGMPEDDEVAEVEFEETDGRTNGLDTVVAGSVE